MTENKNSFAVNFTNNRRITPWLIDFFENKEYHPKIGNALDIWFGIGQDSKYLAEKWYIVDAIDNDSIAIDKAKEFNNHNNVNFIQWDIRTFQFSKKYNLVIAFLSLFSLSKENTKEMFSKIIDYLDHRGYMMIRLLWPKDDWVNKITTRDKEELKNMLLENVWIHIVSVQESFETKQTAGWIMKNWHFIDIIIQK